MNDFEQVLRDIEEFFEPKKPIINRWESEPCNNPSHGFPTHLYIPAGTTHTHTCPGCGKQITIRGSSVRFA